MDGLPVHGHCPGRGYDPALEAEGIPAEVDHQLKNTKEKAAPWGSLFACVLDKPEQWHVKLQSSAAENGKVYKYSNSPK